MPLAVCATPIGNLEDVTLRVLESCARPTLVLCEDTRHTRLLLDRHGISARLLSLPRAQRGRARRRSCCRGSRRASGSRSSPMRDCRGSPIRARGSCARRSPRASPVTVLPGAVGGRDGARRERARRRSATRSSASCRGARRSSRRSGRSCRLARGRSSRSSRRGGSRRSLRSLAAALARARGRRLPRADEAVRGGRARDGRRARGAVRRGRRRARSRSSSAPASRRGADADATAAALRRSPSSSPPARRARSPPRSSPG